MSDTILLDISTAPLPDAAAYLDVPRAPSNWRDEAKIAAYVAEKTAERLAGAALDLDLCCVTGVGLLKTDAAAAHIEIARTEAEEADLLRWLAAELCRPALDEHIPTTINGISTQYRARVVSYNGKGFDWPVLMRRAKYLGVKFPTISTDRYKSPHLDLLEILSDRDPSRRRSLGFYVKRLKMDLGDKPLDGADEARVPETGEWDKLAASLRWDVTAIHRLAQWMGVL